MAEAHIAEIVSAGRAVDRQALIFKASTDADIDVAFETFIQWRVEALLVTSGPLFVTRMDRLVTFAARHALPAMYFRRELVDAGGLVSYTSSTAEGYRQMGIYVGRILKGEKAPPAARLVRDRPAALGRTRPCRTLCLPLSGHYGHNRGTVPQPLGRQMTRSRHRPV
jgi:hypothetical protein